MVRFIESVGNIEMIKNIIFDVGIPVGDKITEAELKEKITSEVKKIDGKLFCVITVDRNLV